MSNEFYIGDTHFWHYNIIKFQPVLRPFSSIEEHNEYIVECWNKRVQPSDLVWHLGDVLFGKANETHVEILSRLNGRKRLVMGNHDQYFNDELITKIMPHFERIYGVAQAHGCVLTHIPVHPNQFHRYKANIHGHTHSHNIEDKRYINVSCEQIGLTPISWDELKLKLIN